MGVAAGKGFTKYFNPRGAAGDFAQIAGFEPREGDVGLSRRLSILQIIRSTDPESGGPIEALLRTSEVLLRDGHEVEVVSLESKGDAESRGFAFPVVALGPGITRYGYNPELASWIRQNAHRFDAVVMHGLWNYSSFGAWRGLRKQATPYFIYAHGMMDPWFRSQYPLKHLAKIAYWWLIEGRVLRDAAGVLFTCEEERVRSRRVFYGHSYKERVLRLGTANPDGNAEEETVAFLSAFPALRDRRFLLFLSRIHPKKGCELLLQAFAEAAVPTSPDIDLVMAGPDQVGWAPGLKSLARNLGIEDRVHWPGMLKGSVKWGAIRSAEAMILPSHQENFGFVVAEAMACSTPVLISNKVNIWRKVDSSQGGLVEPDTLEGTQNLIRRFMALSTEERALMRRAARMGFLRHFDVEATAADLLQLIQAARATI